MKRTILSLFILITIWCNGEAQVSFEERMAISDMVSKWNSAMHLSTIDQLNSLYAPAVLVNGVTRTREACIKEKQTLLTQFAGLHQEIIKPFQISFYQSGTIKCSFIKRVRYKQTVEDYPAYLLLQNMGDHYQITGEGGMESEQSLKAGIKLGEEVLPPSPKGDSYWIIFCTASVLLVVIVIWMMGKSAMMAQSVVYPKTNMNGSTSNNGKSDSKVDRKISTKSDTVSDAQKITLDEEDTDRLFEKFILKKFPKEQFNLVEWRSDESKDHRRQTTDDKNTWPDLQLELASQKFPFAVACKWRNDFWKGIIEWARDAQISAYQEFQLSKDMPVFIALGVGGTPSDPRDLFIIPLGHLYKPILTADWLKKYKRESRENFVLTKDPVSLT